MTLISLSKKERYLLTVKQQETDRPPVWIMRQAGRYMPEYQEYRQKYSFRELCLNPEVSAAVTLLPLDLLDIDLMIIFNDILIPLEQMGLSVDFPDGGPLITNPPRTETDLDRFNSVGFSNPPVAQSLQCLRKKAGIDVPVLGFAGCPYTLVSYAVEGRMSRNAHHIKQLTYESPALLHEMLSRTTETAANYLISQIDEGGADGVQIFESSGWILSPTDYEEFAAPYQRDLIARVKKACPETPIHLYVRGSYPVLESMANSGADVVSVDWITPLAEARRRAPDKALQGNLDPTVLIVPDAVERELKRSLEGFDYRKGWIANLGHGILPQCTMEGARRMVECVKALG